MLAFIEIFNKIGSKMNVLKIKKLKFRSFPVLDFQSFFVRCRRTYVLKNITIHDILIKFQVLTSES